MNPLDLKLPVSPGDVLAGKYRVDRVLGAGGMRVVVAATHEDLDQKVAIKLLLPTMLENADLVRRFLREGRAAAKLKSGHVAKVIDVGRLETGAPYMVLEYLDGGDFSEVLKSEGPLPVATAVRFILQAIEAVAEAHAVQIIHRDLKPQNLFLTHRVNGEPLVKVLDFGISKALEEASAEFALTRSQSLLGSPLYMSPEQMRSSKSVDERSDIWSIGVVMYQLLTSTDSEGYFTMHFAHDHNITLMISYVGFQSDTIIVPYAAHPVQLGTIKLIELESLLEEVHILDENSKHETSLNTQNLQQAFFVKNNKGTFATALEKLPGISAINVGVGITKPVIRGLSSNRIIVNSYGIKQESQHGAPIMVLK